MNLTFMSDEKLSTNPLYPKTRSVRPDTFVYEKKSSPSVEKDIPEANSQLKEGDENITRTANRTCRLANREDELNDHNADKKPAIPASLPPRSRSEGDDEALLSVSESLSLPFVSCGEDLSSRAVCTELQARPETLKRTASAFQRANPASEHGPASGAYPLEKLGNWKPSFT